MSRPCAAPLRWCLRAGGRFAVRRPLGAGVKAAWGVELELGKVACKKAGGMKKRAAMGGVQMFSFLDAMICTLGSLLVLLHAFAQRSQTDLVHKAEAQAKVAQEAGEDPKIELELLQWRVEELKEIRGKTVAQLVDERLRLAHVEDHHRRLLAKLDQLKVAAEQLERLADSGANDRLRDLAALEAARVRLTEARDAVEKARRKSKRAANYSVVPYEGPNSTSRRPIYIECRKDAMILQPEGVELVPEDFAGFLGPGNPLASALRGTREYYARRAPPDKPRSEPYPLLLVRPEGVSTYYAALGALDSWGAEFGYELIGSDWELKFSESDEQLAQLLRQIVADARQRMRELMLATAGLHSNRRGTRLRASSSGGFVAESGPYGGGYGRSPFARGSAWESLDSNWLRGRAASGSSDTGHATGDSNAGSTGGVATRSGGQPSSGRKGYGGGNQEFGTPDDRSPYDRVFDDGPFGDRHAGRHGAGGGALADGRNPGSGDGATGEATARQSSNRNASPSSAPGDGDADSRFTGAAGAQSGRGAASDGRIADGSAGSGSAAGDRSATPGNSAGAAAAGGGSASGKSARRGAHASFGQQGQSGKQGQTCSIADARGTGWGLPDAVGELTGATRPILVECYQDRLVIVPEMRGQTPKVTLLDIEARDSMDEFVSNVWRHMNSWGIAGRGLYWRPTLVMAVDPDATDRYAEIKLLLADSGLDVRARRPSAASKPTNTYRTPTRR